MRRLARLASTALFAVLVAACGSEDNTTAGSDAGGSQQLAAPTVSECSFEPKGVGVVVGHVVMTGTNDTGAMLDNTSIQVQLKDASGQDVGDPVTRFLTLWADGEDIALLGPILAADPDKAAAYDAVASCEVGTVMPNTYAEQTTFDHEAATCEVTDAGVEVDISGVADRPAEAELFATVAIREGEARVDETSLQLAPGETAGTASTVAEGEGLTCDVLEVRLP